ncbi:MAG: hypothetical protein IJX27_07915 [Clostridia bacterium]|nr:hypothetical protein [Clostridia bacterium]
MNIKEIKNKIYAILDIPEFSDESALMAMLDGAARKIAVYTRCIKKSAKLTFEAEHGAFFAKLPADFAVFGYIRRGARIWGRAQFEILGGKIKSSAIAGECELCYFAYPPAVCAETPEETELFADSYACDTAAYGAAMELCQSLYPADVQRYIRIATEYDERMANMISAAGSAASVANNFFSGMRGAFI